MSASENPEWTEADFSRAKPPSHFGLPDMTRPTKREIAVQWIIGSEEVSAAALAAIRALVWSVDEAYLDAFKPPSERQAPKP